MCNLVLVLARLTRRNYDVLTHHFIKFYFLQVVQVIRTELADCPVWICVDETTDALGRTVGHVVIGSLSSEKYNQPFLTNCAFLEETNGESVARLVNDTLRWLDPNFDCKRAKILISDAATYMLRCGKLLKAFFPFLLHITCLAHGLHRVAEKVREKFPDVNRLIVTGKKVFLKAPSRREAFTAGCPNLSLPPEPVVTR